MKYQASLSFCELTSCYMGSASSHSPRLYVSTSTDSTWLNTPPTPSDNRSTIVPSDSQVMTQIDTSCDGTFINAPNAHPIWWSPGIETKTARYSNVLVAGGLSTFTPHPDLGAAVTSIITMPPDDGCGWIKITDVPVVAYTAVELEHATMSAGTCLRSTVTSALPKKFSQAAPETATAAWVGKSTITGPIPTADLEFIQDFLGIKDCKAGTYAGRPIVNVVVTTLMVDVSNGSRSYPSSRPMAINVSKNSRPCNPLQSPVAALPYYLFRPKLANLFPSSTTSSSEPLTGPKNVHAISTTTSADRVNSVFKPKPITLSGADGRQVVSTYIESQVSRLPSTAPDTLQHLTPPGTPPLDVPPKGPVLDSAITQSFKSTSTLSSGIATALIHGASTFAPTRSIPSPSQSAPSNSVKLGAIIYSMFQPPPLPAIKTHTSTTSKLQASSSNAPTPPLPSSTEPAQRPNVIIGSTILTPNAQSKIVVASQTLTPGGPVLTLNDVAISLTPFYSALEVRSSVISLSPVNPAPSGSAPPVLTVGGSALVPGLTSAYVGASQTLLPGGPALSMDSAIISLAPSGTALILKASNTFLSLEATPTLQLPAFTVGGIVITTNAASVYVAAGQTLVPGGPALTINSQVVSLALSATAIILGTTTVPLSVTSGPSVQPLVLPVLTFGTHIVTADSASDFIIGSHTVIPGAPAVTVSGVPISVEIGASGIVIGSNTLGVSPITKTDVPAAPAPAAASPGVFKGVSGKSASITHLYATILTVAYIASTFFWV